MTARIEVSGELTTDPRTTVIGGERIAGAPVLSRLPGREGKGGGDWCVFVNATGAAGEVLAGCGRGDVVSVAGEVKAARPITTTIPTAIDIAFIAHAPLVHRLQHKQKLSLTTRFSATRV